ncbi:MAG: 50S ribosomal protein L11 methyltransferase [Microthrixaceae bacterium]
MSPPDRLVVEVRCASTDSELVAEQLLVLGASAVAESPPADGSDAASADAGGRVVLTADLEPDALEAFSWPGVQVSIVDPGTGWLETWREHASAQRAGRFVIRPPWVPGDVAASLGAGPSALAGEDGEVIDLVVDPGHTFGSGSHETTRLCLELIGRWIRPGDTVLDVGCGSGVLSVAALLAGASRATGIDIDSESEAVSRGAASANAVSDRYRFAGESIPPGRYDVVVTNMLVNEMEGLASGIADATAPGGVIIASGFLVSQMPRVTHALGQLADPPLLETVADGDWRGIALRAPL